MVSVLSAEEELRVARWRHNHGTGEAAALELAGLGDKQLERAVDALKGVLVFESFTAKAPPEAPRAAPAPDPAPEAGR